MALADAFNVLIGFFRLEESPPPLTIQKVRFHPIISPAAAPAAVSLRLV